MPETALVPCPFFIDGHWLQPKLPGTPIFNPSIGEVIAECPVGGIAEASAAVEAGAAAFPKWRETPPVERARILFRFKMLLEENYEELVLSNMREHGKTLAESRGDVKRGMEVVEFTCGVPSLLTGEVLENVAAGIDCEAIRQPLEVCVGITPFNFPAMVPLGMYPIALVCGNTFVPFFGDLHMQGREGVQFFTQQKITTSRRFSHGEGDIWHK